MPKAYRNLQKECYTPDYALVAYVYDLDYNLLDSVTMGGTFACGTLKFARYGVSSYYESGPFYLDDAKLAFGWRYE